MSDLDVAAIRREIRETHLREYRQEMRKHALAWRRFGPRAKASRRQCLTMAIYYRNLSHDLTRWP